MRARPAVAGGLIGVLAGVAVLANITLRRVTSTTGPMLGEHGGTIRSVVIQYTAGASFVWPVYRQFLALQPRELTVYMACPTPLDYAEIRQAIGEVRCTIVPIFTAHPMTAWARDRWIELLPTQKGEPITLVSPKGELQQDIWPQREGDSHVAEDVAHALQPRVVSRRSGLFFDGGDLLCDGPYIFATRAVIARNLQTTLASREALIAELEKELHREVVFMDDAPDHHAGMYMMAVGQNRMIVGDPSLAVSLVQQNSQTTAALQGGADFSLQTQARFDSVAKLAAAHGYQVTRIPVVPAADAKMYLTYVNVIMDERDGESVVYLPTYDDQPALNSAAQKVWESLGFHVRPIDCTSVWTRGGTLHCLVNVLERSPLAP